MGLFDDIVNGAKQIGSIAGDVFTGLINAAPTVIQAGVDLGIINRMSPVQGPVWTMPAMLPMSMTASMNGNSDPWPSFNAACMAQPGCTQALAAALSGMTPAGGAMATMNGAMNGGVDAQLAALGFPPAVIQAVKSVPGLAQRFLGPLVGLGGGLALGAGVDALTGTGKLPRSVFLTSPSGRQVEYKSRGRPILYSGDLAALKRVRRAASRAGRGRRRTGTRLAQIVAMPMTTHHAPCGKCLSSPCSC